MSLASLPTLVVEEDPSTQRLLSEMLAMLGHLPISAASVEEAVTLIEQAHAGFRMLILDVALPGASGIALAGLAVKRFPGLQVVFASGNGFLVADKTDFEFRLLPKPYDLQQLEYTVCGSALYAIE